MFNVYETIKFTQNFKSLNTVSLTFLLYMDSLNQMLKKLKLKSKSFKYFKYNEINKKKLVLMKFYWKKSLMDHLW